MSLQINIKNDKIESYNLDFIGNDIVVHSYLEQEQQEHFIKKSDVLKFENEKKQNNIFMSFFGIHDINLDVLLKDCATNDCEYHLFVLKDYALVRFLLVVFFDEEYEDVYKKYCNDIFKNCNFNVIENIEKIKSINGNFNHIVRNNVPKILMDNDFSVVLEKGKIEDLRKKIIENSSIIHNGNLLNRNDYEEFVGLLVDSYEVLFSDRDKQKSDLLAAIEQKTKEKGGLNNLFKVKSYTKNLNK